MKPRNLLGWTCALFLSASVVMAQEANQIEKFDQQLKQMQENFEKQQLELKENFERLVREQQAQIDALKKQLEGSRTNALPPIAPPPGSTTTPAPVPTTEAGTKPWSPAQPIRIGSAQNYLNISFDGLFAVGTSTAKDIDKLETGGHDPKQRGFTVENIETTLEGKVD